jgi:hypothetical protein
MKVERTVVVMNGTFYIPLSKEHAAHIGVTDKKLDIVIEDYTKSKGAFIAVYKGE